MIIIFFIVSIFSSIVGSICGIGGGVIIKPVLDATGLMDVSSVSFLSGCTVLTMSLVSVYRNIKEGVAKLEVKIATALAVGAAIGGVLGKSVFQALKNLTDSENLVGMYQAIVLIVITLTTLFYTIYKKRIQSKAYTELKVCVLIGVILGIMSSFLGIGGGPINLMVLSYFFSMTVKESALCSLYIIMFSQITSLFQTLFTGTVPPIHLKYLIVMVIGGVAGGMIGSMINKRMSDKTVSQLFIFLMVIIVLINIYNVCMFSR